MIKLIREGAHRYPWLLKSIMALIAVAFVITMGWWGFETQSSNAIASVGSLTVTRDEFLRAYENTYRFYKENVQGEFEEETMKQFVLEGLIENKLWTLAAQDMRLRVSEEELRADILKRPAFQRDGKFDPDLYRRVLAANRLTPALFESQHRMELVRQKAMAVVKDSVALTPRELEEAQALMARQPAGEQDKALSARDRILQDLLFQKQQRALLAYKESLRARVPIDINRALL